MVSGNGSTVHSLDSSEERRPVRGSDPSPVEAAEDDLVEGMVGLAVAAPVQPVTGHLAGGGL